MVSVGSRQVHGSAPDIAGQDIANPMAMVLSAAMMCRYGLDLPKARRRLVMLRPRLASLQSTLLLLQPVSLLRRGKMRCLLSQLEHCAVQVADRLESAVTAALDGGYRTGDLMSPGMQQIGCSALGDVLLQHIEEPSLAKA